MRLSIFIEVFLMATHPTASCGSTSYPDIFKKIEVGQLAVGSWQLTNDQ
ncbi:hypothetical protein [Microcoleus sp. bin38.metabat.b11b12b14.051]|nr:hypothetical protein [Microcoleus sp. bin38.metabat.b11b12b14.051]